MTFDSVSRYRIGRPMRPNGCNVRAPGHGWEVVAVGDKAFCLGCVADEARRQRGTLRLPWFYSGSPHGADILALGVKPLEAA